MRYQAYEQRLGYSDLHEAVTDQVYESLTKDGYVKYDLSQGVVGIKVVTKTLEEIKGDMLSTDDEESFIRASCEEIAKEIISH